MIDREPSGSPDVMSVALPPESGWVPRDATPSKNSTLPVGVPEPGGLAVAEVEAIFRDVAASRPVLGAGVSGLVPDPRNVAPLTRLLAALGL